MAIRETLSTRPVASRRTVSSSRTISSTRAFDVLSPQRQVLLTARNTTTADWHDHLFTATVSALLGIDATSLRVYETDSTGMLLDKAWDWRYGSVNPSPPNHFWSVPAYLSSTTTVAVKALGKWASGETRYFVVAWHTTSGGLAAVEFGHLDGVATDWTATVTFGTTGNVYALNVGGTVYSYTQQVGDADATAVAVGIKNAVNGGTVATATNAAGVLTITPVNQRNAAFSVLTDGTTTTPANLVVTIPARFKVARIGPETVTYAVATYGHGLPLGLGTSIIATRPGLSRSDTQALIFGDYRVNADGTSYGAIAGPNNAGQYTTPLTMTRTGPTIDYTGRVVFSIRSAGDDWLGTYTLQQQHRFYTGRKSDNSGAGTLLKYVDLFRLVYTMTCQRAYTPQTLSSATTAASSTLKVLGFDTTLATFGGNVTEAASNQIAGFSFQPGTDTAPVSYAAAADLSGLPVVGTILGMHGNAIGLGVKVTSISATGFGSQTIEPKWAANNSRATPQLQYRGTSNGSTIPLNAQIVVDCWLAFGFTNNATTVGDNLLPDELVDLLRNVDATPTVTVSAMQSGTLAPSRSGLLSLMTTASANAVTGLTFFRTNAATITTRTRGYAWRYQVKTNTPDVADDDDGSYGVAHALHGLVLRYLRLRDPSLVAVIEDYAQYFVDIEAAAQSAYGSFWSGGIPYWYWPSATPSSGYTSEGGIQEAVGSTGVDPAFGSALGAITYSQGQPRRKTSIDQTHIATSGLWAYLYLLRNETAFTANTTLRANVLALLGRMASFEGLWYAAANQVVTNAYRLCQGLTALNANGIDATHTNTTSGVPLASPYWGETFGTWNVSDTDGDQANASANSSLDDWMRAVWAPDSVESGVRRYMQGRAMDMLLLDAGRHDVLWGASVNTRGTQGVYPMGWSQRPAVASNTTEYESSRSSTGYNGYGADKHLLQFNSTGALDHMSGRAAQRACVLAFTALLDPTFSVPTEQSSTTTLRSVPILTALNDQMRILALYGTEPTTKAQRFAIGGFLGRTTTYDPQIVDSAYTGYWMLATELWHLVQRRVAGTFSLSSYYRFAGV